MRAFSCPICGRLVRFESLRCLHCGSELGFDWDSRQIVALHDRPLCPGNRLTGCNGLVSEDAEWCASCALTRKRPADSDSEGLAGFAEAEAAKRRLLFELLELGLPVVSWREREGGLAFDLLSSSGGEPVTTGHADGVITLDLAETNDAQREKRREELGEPYRTVLGHMRHEIGHYYQDILAPEGSPARDECRAIFGDDREDYSAAMDHHYAAAAPAGWEASYVSAYATMHPWEDWAETFAHYLHIRDTQQTAEAYGVQVEGPQVATTDSAPLHSDPEAPTPDVETLLDAWLPLTYALNAINRSMGAADIYPFVLTAEVQRKLAFVDRCVRVGAP
ncbi:MAG: hypothetical protein QOG42_173 [Solirubrobacteraceae bacterium]|nr:hypothetical protein [Solirubrobacteraceae bacterium]